MERLKIDEEKFTREIKSVIRLANPSYISGKSDVDLDDVLAYLRMVVKYLVFDLEATRRELKMALKRGK